MANVLIVDDAKFMRMTLAKMLENGGHTVVGEAENGQRAIELYREVRPDVVTMDITMPEMTGIEAVKKIVREFPDAKIIICSALGQQKLVVEAIESGAKDFIVKPFDETRVLEAVERVLN
ncbi:MULTISPECIES: response regulator [Heyndrickxia]|jgi:two-component system chemotaxis response regulator CheY|uniref:Chemotaxis protein CheY n=4 Tax=Heyndrickxia TaxID=2837504 RepID=A0A0C5CBN4_HEYCO|nr:MULTISPECIES: response regulator [Heyndrickxia]NWN94695.1 response regulator [Bacillus sp. (in: firmicutes)]AEH53551.1 response regulator receiver protein [Heyndrickxia coagulans 2-6]AEP02200.1 response regulator receiver protein [Heyndrickxia coagulans 36D1]AJH80137.1 chemotaxis protein CheY [Heyndrickxia coagulans DSM 1 = ATCC 7050]AJO22910.1 response regulator receiver protein [Heyndrickxia coagulans]